MRAVLLAISLLSMTACAGNYCATDYSGIEDPPGGSLVPFPSPTPPPLVSSGPPPFPTPSAAH